jgi:hypothetical protein
LFRLISALMGTPPNQRAHVRTYVYGRHSSTQSSIIFSE